MTNDQAVAAIAAGTALLAIPNLIFIVAFLVADVLGWGE